MYPYLSDDTTKEDRKPHDFYETPEDTTFTLLKYLEQIHVLDKKLDRIWEPACGDGKLAEVFRKEGYNINCTDKYKYNYIRNTSPETDFLLADATNSTWIITNPPFTLAYEFIEHSIKLLTKARNYRGGVALLLKSNFWHVKRNSKLKQPEVVAPLTWRPNFTQDHKSPVLDMAWSIWSTGLDVVNHPTHYVPLFKTIYYGGGKG